MLFDTGPSFSGEADSGNRILLPALRGMGITQLDALVLSHDDMDHIGGTESVLLGIPVVNVISTLADSHPRLKFAAHNEACVDGLSWEWDGVNFEMLHPGVNHSGAIPEHDNSRSCVLRISAGTSSVLLTGDIDKQSESRLLKLHAKQLPATLLVVPHHGSMSASSADFVNAVHPGYAVFTSGYRNRFGHPKEEVVDRYRAVGSAVLRSDEDGAISILMDAREFKLERYRRTHPHYWQLGATPNPGAP
jgi:competence protein ComEC